MTKATIILNLIDSYNSEFQYGQNINYVDLKSLMQTAYDLAEHTNYTRSEVLDIIGKVLKKSAKVAWDEFEASCDRAEIEDKILTIDKNQFLKK